MAPKRKAKKGNRVIGPFSIGDTMVLIRTYGLVVVVVVVVVVFNGTISSSILVIVNA